MNKGIFEITISDGKLSVTEYYIGTMEEAIVNAMEDASMIGEAWRITNVTTK